MGVSPTLLPRMMLVEEGEGEVEEEEEEKASLDRGEGTWVVFMRNSGRS